MRIRHGCGVRVATIYKTYKTYKIYKNCKLIIRKGMERMDNGITTAGRCGGVRNGRFPHGLLRIVRIIERLKQYHFM